MADDKLSYTIEVELRNIVRDGVDTFLCDVAIIGIDDWIWCNIPLKGATEDEAVEWARKNLIRLIPLPAAQPVDANTKAGE